MAKKVTKQKRKSFNSTEFVRGKASSKKSTVVKAMEGSSWYGKLPSQVGTNFTFRSAAELEKAWIDYFEYVDTHPWIKKEAVKSGDQAGRIIDTPCKAPYTIMGFQAFHGLGYNFISQLTAKLNDMSDEISKQLSCVLVWARTVCHKDKFEGGVLGFYNANLIARDLELVDKRDVTTNQPVMAPVLNVYNTAPPLAGSEDEIEDQTKPKKK